MTEESLLVAADDCPGDGRLETAPACRARVIETLGGESARLVRTATDGLAATYADEAAALLVAAGRFHERVQPHDDQLAEVVCRRPTVAARRAVGRAGPVGRLVARTGLAAAVREADCVGDSEEPHQTPCASVLRPDVAPTVALGRVCPRLPTGVRLRDRWEVAGGVVGLYETDDRRPLLQLRPPRVETARAATLAAAMERLASGRVERPGAAVRAVGAGGDTDRLTATLRRHTTRLGYLTPLVAVPGVTDLTVTPDQPVRAELDGTAVTTNVRLSPRDAATLASRVRATSGRGLSRANPTANARIDGVRIAAVTEPAADDVRFALRAASDERGWTLPRLIDAGSCSPRAAGVLAAGLERGVAALIAGPRGAGKTTLLAAALWSLPPTARSVVIEDTPELPVERLREAGREVTRLAVTSGDDSSLTPTAAVRTALRLGDGALVVGEVRGREAAALYEAMRVGSAADTTLGTIHGGTPAAVRERVVSDLGVPESAFAATDLVATLDSAHRLSSLTEVRDDGSFAALFDEQGATGVIDRGESRLLETLAGPDETYADVRQAVSASADRLERLVAAGLTEPTALHATVGGEP